jgi:hypothetical protein
MSDDIKGEAVEGDAVQADAVESGEFNADGSSTGGYVADEVQESSGGSRFPRWLIYIGVLIGINVLSYVFNWGYWIY